MSVESHDALDGVVERVSKLRIFGLDGKLRHTRSVSSRAIITRNDDSGLIHVHSPANCTRVAEPNHGCLSDASQVLTLRSRKDTGVITREAFDLVNGNQNLCRRFLQPQRAHP